ncbi:DUF6415 family natural product biosynthesis protein [Streptomyces prunicolor]|uniref:DUF6415 family natural product biosynthesis protein n=1 Tax=Streptomyces prunicolor TaxID=67348 RepID=UPI0022557B34|nr:DUF6415 family natural product biosynthesis protein [Streptomyces prunicolor]MCX5234618.1 DUF6415 family natural product biosynthesis protein [Streptomyces prunicolor]
MANGTADRVTESNPEHEPVDIGMMERTAQEVISDGAKIEDSDELDTVVMLLRGMVMLLVPEIEEALGRFPKSHTPAISARAGIQEARNRIAYVPGTNLSQLVSHAQRLARSVLALTRHYKALGCVA